MHEVVLTPSARELLGRWEKDPARELQGWVLAGGTGLALQLGHRVSQDFDFFRTDSMDVRKLHTCLEPYGSYETLQEDPQTLTLIVNDTKVSFFRVKDPFLYQTIPYRFFSLATVKEIALMKLLAVSSRGSRKDFVDLFTILRGEISLQQCFSDLPRKYGRSRINSYHILKSLTYFEDAESEPLPDMQEPFDWEECKGFFRREAHGIVLP